MKNVYIIFFIIINCFPFNAIAEVAYIDINHILKTSDVGKYLNSQIEKKKIEYNEQYKEIENHLIKKEKILISQKNILKKEEFENKVQILSKEVQKYRKDKQTSIDSLNKFKIDNTKEILKILNPIITNFVDSNSISIVIAKKNIIVGKKNLDITDQILKILNKNISKLNL